MNLTFDIIKIIDAIDRNGSFEAAAVELHKVRSSLTYNIQQIENRLGIMIFDRSQHRAQLTPAGRTLLEQGRQLLKLGYQIEYNIKQINTGWEPVLKIVYDEIINVAPLFKLIDQLKSECPTVNVELYSEVLGGCADALINNRADIAIGLPGPSINRSEFIFEHIGKNKFVFVVAPSHPLAKAKEPLSTELIKSYSAIVARDSSLHLPPQNSMILSDQHRITVSSLEIKRQAQIFGLGVGFLPFNHVKNDISTGKLITKKVEKEQPISFSYIAWNKTNTGKALIWFLNKIKNKKIYKSFLC